MSFFLFQTNQYMNWICSTIADELLVVHFCLFLFALLQQSEETKLGFSQVFVDIRYQKAVYVIVLELPKTFFQKSSMMAY